MILKGKDLITEFVAKNEKAETGMDRWIAVVDAASWKTPFDLKETFRTADKVTTGYIFDINRNNFRIHASVLFATSIVTVLNVGTHKDYDGWDL
jgi:mRNA interferase HigB